MILIITHKKDYTADYVINILNQRSIPYQRLNCEDIMASSFEVRIESDFKLKLLDQKKFSAVWFRRTMLPEVNLQSPVEKLYMLKEFEHLLKNLFSVIDAKWISDPFNVYRAENKLLQLKDAKKIGFTVPETLVSASPAEVRKFSKLHEHIIVKPLYSSKIEIDGNPEFLFTSRLTEKHLEQIDQYDLTPCIFQKEIKKKVEIRVTVVGKNTFAAQVDSQQFEETCTDWRRKKIKFERFELPEKIKNMCVTIVHSLGLRFGAIDLVLTPQNEYVFLEINPNGQWVWIETETGLKIAEALVNELTNEIDENH